MKTYCKPKGLKLNQRKSYYYEVKELYKFGLTMAQIGRVYNITRQRVYQIIKEK